MRAILALNGLNPVTVSENKSDTVIQQVQQLEIKLMLKV